MVAKLFLGILSLLLIPVISIVAMIWGWGLEPQNWWVIVLSYIAMLFLQVCVVLADKDQ